MFNYYVRDVLVQQKPRGVSLDMALLLHEAKKKYELLSW